MRLVPVCDDTVIDTGPGVCVTGLTQDRSPEPRSERPLGWGQSAALALLLCLRVQQVGDLQPAVGSHKPNAWMVI